LEKAAKSVKTQPDYLRVILKKVVPGKSWNTKNERIYRLF
jgi:hypothetical protein